MSELSSPPITLAVLGLEQSWHIFFGCYYPKVGSMLPLVVFAQRRFSLAHETRPLTPASEQ
jgi:hypothetical protein